MKIPYNDLELRIALLGIDGEKFTDEKMKEIEKKFKDKLPKQDSELNKKIAEYHGVSAIDLINSPNYKILCVEYQKNILEEFINEIVEKIGITKKQTWALVADYLGLLD